MYELVCVCVCVCVICKSMCMCVHMCIIVCEWKMLCVLCVYGCVSIFFGPEIHPKYAVAPLHSQVVFFFFEYSQLSTTTNEHMQRKSLLSKVLLVKEGHGRILWACIPF